MVTVTSGVVVFDDVVLEPLSHYFAAEDGELTQDSTAYGHVGIKITKSDELYPRLEEVFALKDELVFVDVLVDPNEHVYPMAVKGGAMKDMVLSKTERT